MAKFTGVALIDQLLEAVTARTNEHGNEVRSTFYSTERYAFDLGLERSCWLALDTEMDAWYFGRWTNKSQLQILSYVEGDIYFTQCPDGESFDAELAQICEQSPPAPMLTTISETEVTRVYEDRSEHFVDPKRCPPSSVSQFCQSEKGLGLLSVQSVIWVHGVDRPRCGLCRESPRAVTRSSWVPVLKAPN